MPSQEILLQLLEYEPATGALTWRERTVEHFNDSARFSATALRNIWNGKCAGKPAFDRPRKRGGYLGGCVLGQTLLAHRVIWKMVYGVDPVSVDHINGNPSDNRLTNLRAAGPVEQARNQALSKTNTSGTMGVTKTQQGRWKVKIGNHYIGVYRKIEDAITARKAAERALGFHPNHGRTNGGQTEKVAAAVAAGPCSPGQLGRRPH